MLKKQLQIELDEANKKKDELQNWLNSHTTHPDFCKIAADRNHLSVKIMSIEFKMQQIEEGKPLLGEAEEFTTMQIERNHHLVTKYN